MEKTISELLMKVSHRLYELPELQEINRLPMHGAEIPFGDDEQAQKRDYTASPWYRSLDGRWEFSLCRRPEDVPENFAGDDFASEGYVTIPGHWRRDSFAPPIYTNVRMPAHFPEPPCVPEETPTGICRRVFTLPAAWKRRRVVLHVGGAESYLEVYLNGSFVGMGKDTRLPSEFDLTPFLVPGRNLLVCKVIRWSDSSFAEDQDQWWMSGIFRSVYLYSTAAAWIEDLFVNGGWDVGGNRGKLAVSLHCAFSPEAYPDGPEKDHVVRFELFDKAGKSLWRKETLLSCRFRDAGYRIAEEVLLPGLSPWSSESPVLYTLTAKLIAPDGKTLDIRSKRTGFRDVRIDGCDLLLNGKRVLIRGVNRHEHHMIRGKALTRQDMLEDIRLLKKFNFNAVRTCHYPDSHIWYDLCDEYGIWVLDETDVECHACYPLLCRDPRWKNLFVTRGERMVLRDRSHACIFGWSVGNESGNGENHEAQIRAMRALDGSRIIHHEGEIKPGWRQGGMVFGEGRKEFNELFDPMYIAPDLLKQYGENAPERPAILCEYAHAMGNSSGSLCDYWKLFYSLPGLQGGFIWDWIDQGLLERRDGKDMLCYGGDFGEEVHDFDFCCNGMIAADRRLHPAMYEFRHLVQPVKVTLTDGGKMTFILKSMRDFVSLADLRGVWSFEIDGAETQRGELPDLSGVGPQDTLKFALPLEKKGTGRRGFVNFRFTLKADAPWAEKGTLLAHDQIEVTAFLDLAPKAVPVVGTSPVLAEKAGTFSLRSGDTRIVVDPSGRGVLKRRGRTLLDTLFEANLFRAGTDNDGIRNQLTRMDKPLGQWLAAGLDALETVSVRVTARGGGEPSFFICRTLRGTDPRALCVFRQRITALRDGSFVFAQSFRLPAKFPSMPRIGVIASAAPGFERVRYFGRGPWENYSDRCASAQYGLYETTVKGMYEDSYILPQENGCRTGVTLLELSSHDQCLRLFADTPFSFGVSHFTAQDLMAARHQCELVPRRETFLAVDLARRGLGTGSCGPQTLPQYRLDEKRYAFTFRLQVL